MNALASVIVLLIGAAALGPATLPSTGRKGEAPTVRVEHLIYEGARFTVIRVALERTHIRLAWKDDRGRRLRTFKALSDHLDAKGERLLFATNAGMFDVDHAPLGLHVEDGREVVPLNLSDGEGNFFLKPNAVFAVTRDGAARIDESSKYRLKADEVIAATQSGPALVLSGKIHPAFDARSPNRKGRSGVGVASPRSRDVVFVLSDEPVTFHMLASVFRDSLHCSDALYLDGVISKCCAPQSGIAADDRGDFAGMLAVTEDKSK